MRSHLSILVFFCSSAAATGTVSKDHPIGGVISLLQKLMIEAKEEGETEAANFQKFTYWCKKSTMKLKRAMKKEKKHIAQFTDQIEGLKKEIETLTFDIDTLATQIAEQETAGAKAADRRQNETELYTKTYNNLDDTIVAVDDAVEVMEVAVTKTMFLGLKHRVKKQSLMGKLTPSPEVEAEGEESTFSAVEGELEALNHAAAVRASKWKNSNKKLTSSVTGLVTATKKLQKVEAVSDKQLPDEFADINLNPGAKNPFKKNKVKVYTEHEGEVIETFRDMEGDLEHDKLDVHQREANAQNAYELAKKARDFSIAAAKDNKREKEDIKSDKGAELAKAESDLAAEEKELAGDTATLESSDQECKQVTEGWDQRSAIRAGEIEAMEMAIKILSKVTGVRNPDTHEIPKKSLAQLSFLQIASVPNTAKAKAMALLREAGKKAHNGALEKLANSIMAFDGPFDKIKAMIQKMTFRLQAEQKDEDDHKNWCDLELQKNQDITDDKTEKIRLTKIKIEEMDAELKLTMKAIVENNEKLQETVTYMEQETELRDENKAEIELTIKDAQAGSEAVAQAITVLKDFYKESGMIAKEPWEFVQISSKSSGVTLPDKPSTWDASYTGVTDPESGSDGVLGILDGVATKFATMESDAKLQDTTDQKNYEKDMAAKKVEIADIKSDTQMKDQKKQGLQEKLDALAAKLKHETSENDAVLQYLKDLKPACAPGEGSYEDRKQARLDEITALRKAQTILEDAFRAKF